MAGIPGVPGAAGIPGHNGLPGRDGIKGDRGNPGLSVKGEKGSTGFGFDGFPGPEGPKGDRGEPGLMGMPGKMGPRSMCIPGQDGAPGQDGQKGEIGMSGLSIKGEKGDSGIKGEKGDSVNIRRSAFTAVKTVGQTGRAGEVITFEGLPTNVNNAFDLTTSKFTCQIPGTYYFTFSFGASIGDQTVISLLKDDQVIISAFAHTGTPDQNYDHISNSAILNLLQGENVWLAFGWKGGATIASTRDRYCSFSGFLLYEN